jgi:hypothetical protein
MQKDHPNPNLCTYSKSCSYIHNLIAAAISLLSNSAKPLFPIQEGKKRGKLTSQELLKTQRNKSIPVVVIPLKYIRHPLQYNTALHEQIETHFVPASLVIGSVQQ